MKHKWFHPLGIPVSWQSKSQKSVSLSSSEAEYIALSEAVKKVMFVAQLLENMQIIVKYPVMVRVDNVGAIFMASNIMTTSHTKHVDIRYKYVNKCIEDGIVKIIFVKSADNDNDILTKNLSALHKKHSGRWQLRSLKKEILALKIFEVKRKGVRCDVLTSNILRNNISLTRVSLTRQKVS